MVSADRKSYFHPRLPLCKPTFLPEKEKSKSLKSERSNSLAQLGQHNKSDDEDITVPVFGQSQEGQQKNWNSKNNKDFTPSVPNYLHHRSLRIENQNSGSDKNVAQAENFNGESDEADKCSQDRGNNESLREIEVLNASEPQRNSPSGDTERSDDMSEASVLDSISAMDISPDDVVGVIGQKHFWKARRAIVK